MRSQSPVQATRVPIESQPAPFCTITQGRPEQPESEVKAPAPFRSSCHLSMGRREAP